MQEFVQVHKVDLLDGEELMDLAKKVMAAITQHRGKIKKSLALQGIFKDHIVVRDMEDGRLFRMKLARSDKGEINLEGMEEVRQTFVPVKKVEKSETPADLQVVTVPELMLVTEGGKLDPDSVAMLEEVAKTALSSEEPAYLKVPGESLWRGVL